MPIKHKNSNISCWHEWRLNFWGITKSANTSIKTLLLNNKEINKDNCGQVHSLKEVSYISTCTALNNGYENFTLVRNPYDRFMSMYKDLVLKRPYLPIKCKYRTGRHNLSIDDFIEKVILLSNDIHVRPQHLFLNEAKEIKIFKLEQINKLEKFLKAKIPLTNKTNGTIELTAAQKEIIFDKYQEDFEQFNYIK